MMKAIPTLLFFLLSTTIVSSQSNEGDSVNLIKLRQNYFSSQEGINIEKTILHTIQLSDFLVKEGHFVEAEGYALEAVQKLSSIENSNSKLIFKVLDNYSIILEKIGRLNDALLVEAKKREFCIKIGDKKELGNSYLNAGFILEHYGDFEQALLYIEKGLRIGEGLNDLNLMAKSHNNLANIYSQTMRNELAIKHFFTALKLYELSSAPENAFANVYSNLSIVYSDLENFDTAIFYLNKTLVIDRKLDYKEGVMLDYSNLGATYKKMGEYEKAKLFCEKALDLSIGYGLKYDESIATFNLADIHFRTKNFQKAEEFANRSIKAIHGQSNLRMSEGYEILYQTKEATKDYKQAFEYYKLYQTYRDSTFTLETEKKIEELEAELNIEKSRREIKFLKNEREYQDNELNNKESRVRFYSLIILFGFGVLCLVVFMLIQKNRANKLLAIKNREIKAQKTITETVLNEKEILLKEIHHRVKNNLQTVSSLLSLQTRYLSDENAIQALKESENRLLSISLLHQKLYQNKNLAIVDLDKYVHDLTDRIKEMCNSSDKNILVKVSVANLECNIDLAMALGLIINELMTNAFKYAFTEMESGIISVELKLEDQLGYQLIVSDNGIGLPPGFSIKESKSMGFNLVQLLTRQIKGKIDLENGSGTRISIQFNQNQN